MILNLAAKWTNIARSSKPPEGSLGLNFRCPGHARTKPFSEALYRKMLAKFQGLQRQAGRQAGRQACPHP